MAKDPPRRNNKDDEFEDGEPVTPPGTKPTRRKTAGFYEDRINAQIKEQEEEHTQLQGEVESKLATMKALEISIDGLKGLLDD